MSICFESFKQAKRWFAGAVIAPLCVASVSAAPLTESMIMPKSDHSLLLDLERVGNRICAVGERGHVLFSDDQGEHWQQVKAPVSQMLTAVDFVDDHQGWAVGHDGNIIHTSDGGKTWVVQRNGLDAQAEMNQTAFHEAKQLINAIEKELAHRATIEAEGGELPPVPAELEKVDPYSGEIMSLEEALEEAKWQLENAREKLNKEEIAFPLMDIWFADSKHGWAVGAFGGFLKTADGGETWEDARKLLGNIDNYHLNAIGGTADGAIFVGGEAGYLMYSLDGGETWTQGDLGYDGTIFGIVTDATGQSNDVVITGLRGHTFISRDDGTSWEALHPGVDFSLASGRRQGDHLVLVGSGGSIAVSKDGGASFERYTLPARSSLSSVIMLDDSRLLMVGQGGIHHFDTNATAEQ